MTDRETEAPTTTPKSIFMRGAADQPWKRNLCLEGSRDGLPEE